MNEGLKSRGVGGGGGWWEGSIRDSRGDQRNRNIPDNFGKKQILVVSSSGSEHLCLPDKSKEKEELSNMKKESLSSLTTVQQQRTCRVLFKYSPDQEDELSLDVNDIIECSGEAEDGWWKGTLRGKTGVFPSNFVEVIATEKEELQQQVVDKNKRNKEFHYLTQGCNDSRVSKPNIEIDSSPPIDSRIPKLPPKPVKEHCIVQYPYDAQNEDELSLIEGQILNIISKDSEDKGWWRGEVDGKIGVFPDNFVKMVKVLNPQEISNSKQKIRALSPNRGETFDKGGSREKLSGVRHSHSSPSKSSPSKKGSFGKANPPPKPKAPCPNKLLPPNKSSSSSAVNIGQPSRGSFLPAFNKPSHSKSTASTTSSRSSFSGSTLSQSNNKMSNTQAREEDSSPLQTLSKSLPNEESVEGSLSDSKEDFDGVSRSERLAHPTADRVKGPKRRPPSSIFTKDVIALDGQSDDEDENTFEDTAEDAPDNGFSRESKDVIRDEDPDSEPITRSKEDSPFTHNNNNNGSLPNSKSSSPVNAFKEELQSRLEHNNNNSNAEQSASESSSQVKKPDWLEELSRKQANRKSGFFNDKAPTSRASAPIISDKPQLPTKPSQIRDDIRKLNKRVGAVESSSDKENNRPNRSSSGGGVESLDIPSSSSPPLSSVVAEAKNPWVTDDLPISSSRGSQQHSRKHSYSDSRQKSSEDSGERRESLIEQRVSKLENTLLQFSERLQFLEESLKEERGLRIKLQEELETLRK